MRTGELGHWWRSLDGPPQPRPPLPGPIEADVTIVGAGYTGLWTAYYLKRALPSLEIVLLEREVAGFGASGRNGDWVSGFFSALRACTKATGRAHLCPTVARGRSAQDFRRELRERLRVAGARGATFSPHVARVHPAKLLVGLAAMVERLGVRIHERKPVSEIRAHEAITPAGSVRARWMVRATEGYTADLAGLRPALLPMNSSMIVTEPLSVSAWDEIGWGGRELIGDGAHASGRTMRDLILGERTGLTALPWVDRRPRCWEPEPIRWAAIHSVYSLYRRADRIEQRTGRPSRLARVVDAVSARV